jgi:hypothetical protein
VHGAGTVHRAPQWVRTGRSRPLGPYRRPNRRETFAYSAAGRDIDEHRADQIGPPPAHFLGGDLRPAP